jgi:regulator of replication initiation timing
MADHRFALRQIEQMQERIAYYYEDLGALKLILEELIAENHRLAAENAHLREQVRAPGDGREAPPGEAVKYLGQLYEDGFHICNINYGSLREGDCLFCMQNLQRTS